jgi:hypothetical protein
MNIDSKKATALAMYLPLISLFGGATIWAAGKIGVLIEFGHFSVPESASYEQILSFYLYEIFAFLGLVGIARGILYVKGETKKRWTFLFYFCLPFVLTLFLSEKVLHFAWMVIAGLAWVEVLLIWDPFGLIKK